MVSAIEPQRNAVASDRRADSVVPEPVFITEHLASCHHGMWLDSEVRLIDHTKLVCSPPPLPTNLVIIIGGVLSFDIIVATVTVNVAF